VDGALEREFRDHYQRSVDEVLALIGDEQLARLARHNPAWGPGRFDIATYLRASEVRYVKALKMAERHAPGSATGRILDVGGFLGTFPLAAARIGASVTLSEKYSYYYGAFDEIQALLCDAGVTLWDEDLTQPPEREHTERFDLITNMALLEHLAHSPKHVMVTVHELLASGARAITEVPNIGYWPRRLAALRGQTIHPSLRDVYDAEEPFTGHHREYTAKELNDLLRWSGFAVDEICTYSYVRFTGVRRLVHLAFTRMPAWRDLIMACARAAPPAREAAASLSP